MGIHLVVNCLYSIENVNGAFDVIIPTYNSDGRINWELKADEVDTIDEGLYRARNPKIFILEKKSPSTIANSNSGTFNINQGIANGTENLYVEGQGFEAIGRPWIFEENIDDGRNRLSFIDQGKIGFESGVNSGFISGQEKKSFSSTTPDLENIANSKAELEPQFSKDFPTTAYGRRIDLYDLGDGRRRIVLENDVFINIKDLETNSTEGKSSTISCDWAEIFIGKDQNKSLDSFGRISEIHAVGRVRLNQPLRQSSADELKWSDDSGRVDLFGGATVFHQEWGEAHGERIIIWEVDGRAEVVGGNQGRSRLLLPALSKPKAK